MVDPNDVTKYDRTTAELEEFLLFGVCVQGKNSQVQSRKLEQLLSSIPGDLTPLQKVERMVNDGSLEQRLREVKMGRYNRIPRCFAELVDRDFDLRTVTVDQLESVYSIGCKTSRFFLMHSRPKQNLACLDVHILRWLRDQGHQNIPESTPGKEEYHQIEKLFLNEATERGMSPEDLDLKIWIEYSQKAGTNPVN